MKLLKSEKGYSLLLTLMIIVLFSILGTSLIAMSMNGMQKNDTRERTIQSNDLATKGINHITAQITSELNTALANNGLSASNYVMKITEITNKYKCTGGSPIEQNASTGAGTKYSTCIQKIEDDLTSGIQVNAKTEYLRKNITFKSTGISGNKNETFYSTYSIGATNYPEVLNYAVGAYEVDSTDTVRFPKWQSGEGNLVLNGGVSIEGDVKVDGDLITSDYGIWRPAGSGYQSVESVLPQISGIRANYGRIYVGGKMYKAKNMNIFFNKSQDAYNNYTNSNGEYTEVSSIADLFLKNTPKDEIIPVTSPQKIANSINIKPIDFDSKKNNIYINPTSQNRYIVNSNREIINLNLPHNDTFLSVQSGTTKECKNEWVWIIEPYWGYDKSVCKNIPSYYDEDNNKIVFKFFNNNTVKNLTIPGSANFSNTKSLSTDKTYIGGSLSIGELDRYGNCQEANKNGEKPKIEIKGVFYVKNNLTICDRKIISDAIFYVKGEITIQESIIEGISLPGTNQNGTRVSSLMLFSQGDIHFSNNSVDQNLPSDFKGYLYSEKELEIYGVGSNIRINGGISARKIILNAIRGSSRGTIYESRNTQKDLPKTRSRLQVIYDQDIIKNFSELDVQTEPWIENVSPPTELDRSYTSP